MPRQPALINMEFIRGQHNIASRHFGCVASVGNYDGIHPGHQAVIRSLVAKGRELELPVTIISFEPHPMEFFVPDAAPARLMSIRNKIEALKLLQVDRFCCLRFDHRLANTEAEEFVSNLLVGKLGVRYIKVGDDFRFGRNRRGNFDMLCTLGKRFGMQCEKTQSVRVGDVRVSSARIRESLAAGNLTYAKRLLADDYSLSGKVIRGDGNAARWGFATANIQTGIKKHALSGIFTAHVEHPNGERTPAVASLGVRPTIGGSKQILETHLLDYSGDLYGQRLRVVFLKKLRDEVKFSSIETMCTQISQDILRTAEYFRDQSSLRAS